MQKKQWLLLGIVLFGAVLRLYVLDRGDAISDEVLYGFRAIGMLDFDFAVAQPSTLQLFNNALPWWVRLSFHDHPILVFLVQHIFMGIFGVNLWGMRLSSSLFGIASVYLIYLIGKKLFSEKVGLFAAALLASNVLMLYVSRTAVQESQVIFFVLLSVYAFMKAQEDKRYYLAFGASFGLGLLSKYTVGFLAVPLLTYLCVYQRRAFRDGWVYLGAIASLVIFSPAILYNIFLYREFGHFDFQLFYMFGQKVPYWATTPGKEIGGLADRLVGIPVNLWQYGSWTFALLSLVAIVWLIVSLFRKHAEEKKPYVLLGLIITVNVLLYLFIGPSPRFLALLIPWLVLCIAAGSEQMLKKKILFVVMCVVILFWESWYAYNSYIRYQPIGPEIIGYSKIHWDMHPWGFNELDAWFTSVLAGNYPRLTIPYTYTFLEAIKNEAVAEALEEGREPVAYLFVFDDSMANLASLWIFQRRSLYGAWPIISAESYTRTLENEGDDFYKKNGFTDLYFIKGTDAVLQNLPDRVNDYGTRLRSNLAGAASTVEEIRNHAGQVVFEIYHMPLIR